MRNGQALEVLQASITDTPGFAAIQGTLTPGESQALLRVTQGEMQVDFGPFDLLVHPDLAAAEEEEHALAEEEDPEAIAFSVEQQWTARTRSTQVERRDLAERVAVAGEFETPPQARAEVASSFAGRLLPPSGGALPQLGDSVEAGQVLAEVEVPLSVGDLAALRDNSFSWHEHEHELLLRDFDLQAQRLKAEQDGELARTEIDYATSRLERMQGLHARGLATDMELENARQSLTEAELHRVSAQQLLDTLAQIGGQLDALRAEHAEDTIALEAQRFALIAPISGVIEAAPHGAGATLSESETVFRIVDGEALWLRLHVPERHVPQLAAANDALLTLAATPDQVWSLAQDLQGMQLHLAQELDLQTRTLAAYYAVQVGASGARAGMFADALLAVQARPDVVAIPRAAVVQQDGLNVAFVQIDGEHFEKRVLDLGVEDGAWVEVRRGLEEGERVVFDGAYLIRLAASAPDSFGHGHVH